MRYVVAFSEFLSNHLIALVYRLYELTNSFLKVIINGNSLLDVMARRGGAMARSDAGDKTVRALIGSCAVVNISHNGTAALALLNVDLLEYFIDTFSKKIMLLKVFEKNASFKAIS
ncbi:hypothetical protein J6590_019059 [Homalodisca vitripennis]|nr:hypothetical protein J6590_019059 [Homalodisca vitripennis]